MQLRFHTSQRAYDMTFESQKIHTLLRTLPRVSIAVHMLNKKTHRFQAALYPPLIYLSFSYIFL